MALKNNTVNYIDNQTIITATNLNNIQNSIVELEESLGLLDTANAGFHNSIYRGINVGTKYGIPTVMQRIANGTFEDLFIGDYFDIIISTTYTSSEVVRCVIAGFDTYYLNGDTSFNKHHAVIVPKNCFSATAQMNSTNTTEGGFMGSAMWKTVLPTYSSAIANALSTAGGELLTHRTLLSNSMSTSLSSMAGAGWTGASNNWEWTDTTLSLLSEIQLYGSTVLSSSLYDTGCDNLQLPLFRLNPASKIAGQGGTGDGGRIWYWLRAVAASTNFCFCYGDGGAAGNGAGASAGVRPLFCVGKS